MHAAVVKSVDAQNGKIYAVSGNSKDSVRESTYKIDGDLFGVVSMDKFA